MATYNLAKTFLVLGSIPFFVLGLLHVVLTLLDIKRPGALSPDDRHVRIAMHYTRLRISGQTTMWKAWIGSNLSHGAGMIVFSCWPSGIALLHFDDFLYYKLLLPVIILISLCYCWMAIMYWFKGPAVLIGLGSGLIGAAWVIMLTMPVNML